MNVFDFDHTLYAGDSTVDFYRYCVKRRKGCLKTLPGFAVAVVRYRLGRIDKTALKQQFYGFLTAITVDDALLEAFWNAHRGKLKPAILALASPGDVVISASPTFLLQPICDELDLTLIASEVDPSTGRCLSKNCHDAEKARRFKEAYPNGRISGFYSDSRSDAPLAALAAASYLVKGDRLEPFPLD